MEIVMLFSKLPFKVWNVSHNYMAEYFKNYILSRTIDVNVSLAYSAYCCNYTYKIHMIDHVHNIMKGLELLRLTVVFVVSGSL